MVDHRGKPLPHFTPIPTPASLGVNVFAQDLPAYHPVMQRPYAFPPSLLVVPLLRFLKAYQQACTLVVLDVYPRKYWWPLITSQAQSSYKLASAGDSPSLLVPSTQGWVPHPGNQGDLWAFSVKF